MILNFFRRRRGATLASSWLGRLLGMEPWFVQGTLDWCNEQRAKQGMKPLRRLPKGKRTDVFSCPCGKATGLKVYGGFAYESSGSWPDRLDTPKAVQVFVPAFDAGKLPQYDIDA